MITRFDPARLEEFFSLHDTAEINRARIREQFDAPGRTVRSSLKNVAGVAGCPKMRFGIQFESHRVEFRGLLDYIYDDDVFAYLDQPKLRLDLSYKSKSGRPVRHPHRPDFLVLSWTQGFILDEWKDQSNLDSLLERYPHRYLLDSKGHLTSPPAEESAASIGAKYRIRSSEEISSTRFRNYRYLFDYFFTSDEEIAKIKEKVDLLFDGHACLDTAHVRTILNVEEFHIALANRLIAFQIDEIFAGHFDRLLLYKSESVMQAMTAHYRPRSHQQANAPCKDFDSLCPGDRLVLHGEVLDVQLMTPDCVIVRSKNGSQASLSREFVNECSRQGELKLPIREIIDPAKELILRASEKEIADSIAQMQLAERYLSTGKIPAEYAKSKRSFYRGLKKYREFSSISAQPFAAYLDSNKNKGFHGSHLPEELDKAIRKHIEEYMLTATAPSALNAHSDFLIHLTEPCHHVSYKTYRSRYVQISRSERALKREGSRSAYQEGDFYEYLADDVPVHGDYFMNIVHIDHQLLQINLVSSITREAIDKVWLTVAFCAFTRTVLAFYLSFTDPGYMRVMMVMIELVRRHGRFPSIVVADGGKEFSSTAFEQSVIGYGAIIKRRNSKPRVGSVMERAFGMTEGQFINNVLGNTKIMRKVRIMTKQVNPKNFAQITLSQLHRALEEFFFEIYDTNRHPSILMTPRFAAKISLEERGTRFCKSIQFDDTFLVTVLPYVDGKTRTIDPQRGVKVDYVYFHHRDFNRFPKKIKSAPVKRNPLDPNVVFVYVEDRWHRCESNCLSGHARYDEWDSRSLYQEWLEGLTHVHPSAKQKNKKIARLIAGLHSASADNTQILRDLDSAIHDNRLMEGTTLVSEEAGPEPDYCETHDDIPEPNQDDLPDNHESIFDLKL